MSTICAPATPSGGAIAIIRISGPETISIVSSVFSKDIRDAKGYTLHYGHIMMSDDGCQEGLSSMNPNATECNIIDDVLVSVFRAPHSYTGEDSIEISCHGSSYIVQKILEALIHRGARMANPGEFTKRAFLAGKMDLSQAEAVADLIAASNKAAHHMAMSQMRGGVSNELNVLRQQLLHITSLIELELDFSDHEDIEFADRKQLNDQLESLYTHVQRLVKSFHTGNALKTGIPVAIIGAPNVGKSTLLNLLVHEERAIVSDIQGTTRDLIEDTIQIDGIPFRIIDTAGLRTTTDRIERMGIERSLKAAQNADIIILLSEPNKDFPDIKPRIATDARPQQIILRVINKSDLVVPDSSFLYHSQQPNKHIHISSLTRAGIPNLQKALISAANTLLSPTSNTLPSSVSNTLPSLASNALSSSAPPPLPSAATNASLLNTKEIGHDTTIITNLRHYESLHHILDAVSRTKQSLSDGISGDLIAEDLRQCLHHLANITGEEITSDEILTNIFQNFCIGK